jgi:hypothetical protein
MAITDQDIRLMASERLADTEDGGGRMTGTEVVDGVSNNLFPDVSELDRTIGRVALRKAFPAVLSENRDPYYGANVIIDRGPADPNVSVTLFSTKDWTDERAAAVSRMESYLARGPRLDGYLYDQHIAGQKALMILMRTDRQPPVIGATIVVVKDPGLSTEAQQFVRITGVASAVQTFSGPIQPCGLTTYTRQVVTVEISDALLWDVQGGTPHCGDDTTQEIASRLYSTVVADAATYAGITALSEAVTTGALTVRAASIFTQLVPSAQTEIPITDATPHGNSAIPLAAGGEAQLTTSVTWGPGAPLYVGQGLFPGSLAVEVSGATVTDRAGLLLVDSVEIGTVDYSSGILTIGTGGPNYGTASKTITFVPAAQPVRGTQSAGWDITPESRSGTLVFLLDPRPAPGALAIHYMAQGKWYVLRDDASGALRGADSSYGSGVVNYATGSVVVTLGALPDVGSTTIATWGTQTQEIDRSGAAVYAEQLLSVPTAEGTRLTRNGVTLTWPDGLGGNYTAAANAAGDLSGDATGRVNYADSTIRFRPNVLPPSAAVITVSSNYSLASTSISGIDGSTITLSSLPAPGSVELVIPVTHNGTVRGQITIVDDGANGLKVAGAAGVSVTIGTAIGSINYDTGVCSLSSGLSGSYTTTVTTMRLMGEES